MLESSELREKCSFYLQKAKNNRMFFVNFS
jgi:hypothetical protein